MKHRITHLKITDFDISEIRWYHNPIVCALYRGTYVRYGVDQKAGGYQGNVKFDVRHQCYWIWTGESGRPPLKAGELLQIWLSAWYHRMKVFPITIAFTDDTAEVVCDDTSAFLGKFAGNG